METLQALLYRAGAVACGSTVFVSYDPFGGWMDACASLGLDGGFYVYDSPPTHIKDATTKRWFNAARKGQARANKRLTGNKS